MEQEPEQSPLTAILSYYLLNFITHILIPFLPMETSLILILILILNGIRDAMRPALRQA